MVSLGIIGLSPGNGHPFSFSAIINGYDKDKFELVGWPGILNYLNKKDLSEISSLDARVTHVWTQDLTVSKHIAAACKVEKIVNNFVDMIGEVDAVIIARDDYEEHLTFALPFLKHNIPVFVDKPLTLKADELREFRPFIENGLLMTCSGFRYCGELDSWRSEFDKFGSVKLIQAAVINGWNKYGIHMIDAILSISSLVPVSVESVTCGKHEAVNIEMENGTLCQINALGPDVVTFSITVYGSKLIETVNVRDNFTAFRRTLFHFIEQVKCKAPSIPPESTLLSLRTLIAGRKALDEGIKVYLKDIEI